MKAAEIEVGGKYVAKVSNKLVVVRVDGTRTVSKYIRNNYSGQSVYSDSTVYDVTNTVTGRKTVFRSAAKFRKRVNEG